MVRLNNKSVTFYASSRDKYSRNGLRNFGRLYRSVFTAFKKSQQDFYFRVLC